MANSNIRDDFVLVSLFMGNDYLLKLEYVNYTKLWECYDTFAKQNNGTLINNDGKFHIDNMKTFMSLINSSLSNGYKNMKGSLYDRDRVKSYLNGLLWCFKTYSSGTCTDYSYAYTDKMVHPYELYLYLCWETVTYETKFSLPISHKIYPLLIMPFSAKNLIPQKFHNLMDNELNYLYNQENCSECKILQNTYKQSYGKIANCKNNLLAEKLKRIYLGHLAKFREHKKIHVITDKFGPTDIENIIRLCKKI